MKDKFGNQARNGDLIMYGTQPYIVVDEADGTARGQWGFCRMYNDQFITIPAGVCTSWDDAKRDLLKLLGEHDAAAKHRASSRIKKSQFRRYGVYCKDEEFGWEAELYLGPCTIYGEKFKSAWVQMIPNLTLGEPKNYKDVTRKMYKDLDLTVSYRIRDCKYPLKHQHLFDIDEDEILALDDVVLEATKGDLEEKIRWKD